MPKHGNIFTNWFKSGKQKHKKSTQPIKNQANAVDSTEQATAKRSPLVPRPPINDNRSELSPRRRTSIFGLTFGLASSTGSSRLSLLSGGMNKQSVQHKSTSCIETQFCNHQIEQNGSMNRKCSVNVESSLENSHPHYSINNAQEPSNHSQASRSPATPPRKQSKSGSITSVNFLQQLAAQLHPGRTSPRSNAGSASSSIHNIPSGKATPTPPRSPTSTGQTNNNTSSTTDLAANQTVQASNQSIVANCNKTSPASSAFHRTPSFKQTSVIFSSGSLDKSSAFTPILSSNTNSKAYLHRQATTQQQKQIQFQQQHHSTNQSYSFQKLVYNQPLNDGNLPSNLISSSGLITTINESFTESNQDSSDAEIVEVFAGGEQQQSKTQTDTLDLVDEQLLFSGNDEKTNKDNRPFSPAPFNLTPSEKEQKQQQQQQQQQQQIQPDDSKTNGHQQDKNNNQLDESCDQTMDAGARDEKPICVKKKTSFADENNDSKIFPKCKLNHRDTLHRDSLKDGDDSNLADKLDDNGKALKRKSVDIVDLADSTEQLEQQQQGAEEIDSFGELINNEEDFSLYENRAGLGDDMKFLGN